ncbi:2-oxoacid:acceptor oxidoreductase family protein [Candidatus Bipolaricaulota bacterium]|nr:2-oxoacid:acceptor oxidoreductase family protein [Candidatus Bipolaricaulota bacterium]
MSKDTLRVQFCGFGGQGIVLSSQIFGTASVRGPELNAVQTQSFGSEARGGECQAELILSKQTIFSPSADEVDLMVALSQPALNGYEERLKSGGYLLVDPELVTSTGRTDVEVIELEARKVAGELGLELVANMVVLGFLQEATGVFSRSDLFVVIEDSVKEKFVKLDVQAAERGMEIARERGISLEVSLDENR